MPLLQSVSPLIKGLLIDMVKTHYKDNSNVQCYYDFTDLGL